MSPLYVSCPNENCDVTKYYVHKMKSLLTLFFGVGIDNGNDLERSLLEAIYEGVKKEPIISGRDHLDFLESIDKSIVGKKLSLMDPWRMLMMVSALWQN